VSTATADQKSGAKVSTDTFLDELMQAPPGRIGVELVQITTGFKGKLPAAKGADGLARDSERDPHDPIRLGIDLDVMPGPVGRPGGTHAATFA